MLDDLTFRTSSVAQRRSSPPCPAAAIRPPFFSSSKIISTASRRHAAARGDDRPRFAAGCGSRGASRGAGFAPSTASHTASLVWSGPKPSTGLPAAAREARYRLLAEAAQAEGIGLVLTGHTADDQAETVLMRQARDEGRGPCRHGARDALRLADLDRAAAARPPARRRCANSCAARTCRLDRRSDQYRQAFRAAARPRGAGRRQRFAALCRSDCLGRAGCAASASGLDASAAALIRALCQQAGHGSRPRSIPALPPPATARLQSMRCASCWRRSAASPFLPDEARSEALFDRLRTGPLCATLSRTVVDARRAGVFLRRESPQPAGAAAPAAGVLWDGRRCITLRLTVRRHC